MKTDFESENLKSLLAEWRVEAPLPPRFAENVWRRIEAGGSAGAGVTLWQLARSWLERTFVRPAVALAYCAVLMGLGLGFGLKQGQQQSARTEAQLQAQYVQSLSPYTRAQP